MPELYGQPRKEELRKQIRELSNDLREEQKRHREVRHSLESTRAYRNLLVRKLESMEGKLKGLLAEASQEISDKDIVDEMKRVRRAEFDAVLGKMHAEADAPSA